MARIYKGHEPREARQQMIYPFMLAKEPKGKYAKYPIDDPEWSWEHKWDGYRMMLNCGPAKGDNSLRSRNNIDRAERYPGICEFARKHVPRGVVFDGEIVVFNEHGVTDFQMLQSQEKMIAAGLHVSYIVFDIIYYKGKDYRHAMLQDRRELLTAIFGTGWAPLGQKNKIMLGGWNHKISEDLFDNIRRWGTEGVIFKHNHSKYSGQRCGSWLKWKAKKLATFEVVGFTEPTGSRVGFGALVLAERTGDGLRYVGRVGSGFEEEQLHRLNDRLRLNVIGDAPDSLLTKPEIPKREEITWIRPEKIWVEVEFMDISVSGVLRQPIFKKWVIAS